VAVALSLPLPHWVDVFSGIRSWVTEQGLPWDLLPLSGGFETTLREWCAERRIDGVIGTLISSAWLEGLGAGRPPTVHIAWWAESVDAPTVSPDFGALGELAGRHLLEQQVGELVFLGLPGMAASSGIESGFRRVAEAGGVPLTVLRGRSPGLWAERLLAMGPGVGLHAVDDELARLAVAVLRDAGKRIPDDVAVVGCGDFPSESIRAGIDLSSPTWEMSEIGREAARLLDEAIAGECMEGGAGAGRVVVGLAPFVPGPSSLRLRASDRVIAACIGFMREHLDRPVGVDELARRAGMSRRKFEIAFKSFAGCGPYRHLQNLRLDAAARLLRETDDPMHRVAAKCGFGTQHLFSAAFREWAGVPPSRFRAKQRQGPAACWRDPRLRPDL
jgi:AraC-like DNA-binding protein/DNA-binding LacI/PurR family transcriptional regulator